MFIVNRDVQVVLHHQHRAETIREPLGFFVAASMGVSEINVFNRDATPQLYRAVVDEARHPVATNGVNGVFIVVHGIFKSIAVNAPWAIH